MQEDLIKKTSWNNQLACMCKIRKGPMGSTSRPPDVQSRPHLFLSHKEWIYGLPVSMKNQPAKTDWILMMCWQYAYCIKVILPLEDVVCNVLFFSDLACLSKASKGVCEIDQLIGTLLVTTTICHHCHNVCTLHNICGLIVSSQYCGTKYKSSLKLIFYSMISR